MNIEQLFFELLQVAIGTRQTLSVKPTSREWALLFEIAKKQALTAIAFAGVRTLSNFNSLYTPFCSPVIGGQKPLKGEGSDDSFGDGIGIDELTYLKWLGLTAKVAQRNKVLSDACASLCKDLAHDGLYACILKGQSNLVNYPEELRDFRTPGDIDVWCGLMDPEGIDIAVGDSKGAHYEKYQGERGVIEWVLADWRLKNQNCGESSRTGSDPARDKTVENPLPEVQYHHIDWEYKGIECEVHFKPSWMNCPWHNARLQRWCKDNEQFNLETFEGFNIPTVEFNAVYQLVHIYRHLFNEGIGLRQLLDYYFVLEKTPPTPTSTGSVQRLFRGEFLKTLKSFGMVKFFFAVLWVIREVFDPNLDIMVWEKACRDNCIRFPNLGSLPKQGERGEGLGEFLLNEIMLAGNFGKYDSRNVIGANEGYLKRFIRRQKRFMRFLTQYPSEVIWGPYFSVKQRVWRMWHGWR